MLWTKWCGVPGWVAGWAPDCVWALGQRRLRLRRGAVSLRESRKWTALSAPVLTMPGEGRPLRAVLATKPSDTSRHGS